MNTIKIMTVKGLKDLLIKLKRQGCIADNTEIWLSSDEEGNSFSPMAFDPRCSICPETDKNKLIIFPSTHDICVQEY